ncbi:MAG: Hsp20/alpha crystallin family protein [Chloroflexi bacterium]|nr:Hsp20/alpha crystallin family protein [Chloroflexota bacterium]
MTNYIRMNPIRNLVTLPEAMDRFIDHAFIGPAIWRRNGHTAPEAVTYRLPIDAYNTDGEIVVQAAFPGVPLENISITVEDDTLTISAELPAPIENVNYVIAERPHGKFSRALTLNVPVDADKAEARFENGLLTLTLPKAETARPKTITVTAK